jgi:hypothetical protein
MRFVVLSTPTLSTTIYRELSALRSIIICIGAVRESGMDGGMFQRRSAAVSVLMAASNAVGLVNEEDEFTGLLLSGNLHVSALKAQNRKTIFFIQAFRC